MKQSAPLRARAEKSLDFEENQHHFIVCRFHEFFSQQLHMHLTSEIHTLI